MPGAGSGWYGLDALQLFLLLGVELALCGDLLELLLLHRFDLRQHGVDHALRTRGRQQAVDVAIGGGCGQHRRACCGQHQQQGRAAQQGGNEADHAERPAVHGWQAYPGKGEGGVFGA